jgi:hypothetical protein
MSYYVDQFLNLGFPTNMSSSQADRFTFRPAPGTVPECHRNTVSDACFASGKMHFATLPQIALVMPIVTTTSSLSSSSVPASDPAVSDVPNTIVNNSAVQATAPVAPLSISFTPLSDSASLPPIPHASNNSAIAASLASLSSLAHNRTMPIAGMESVPSPFKIKHTRSLTTGSTLTPHSPIDGHVRAASVPVSPQLPASCASNPELDHLRKLMNQAIAAQEFETCVSLRNRIRELESVSI